MKYKNKSPESKRKSSALSKANLTSMLAATYKHNKEVGVIDNYVPDPTLSDNRVKVFYNPTIKHTVVAHRGSKTASDWLIENPLYALGIKRGSNWSHAKKVQQAAEKKYGVENLTTIGHSKGALHAQEFGQKGDVITSNKPVNIPDLFKKVPESQTDYVGEGDLVSLLRPLQRGKKAVVLTKGKTLGTRLKEAIKNPTKAILGEHSYDTILRKERNKYL